MHIFHKWSKWEEINRGETLRQGTSFVIGQYLVQKKACTICGLIKLKEVRT